MRTIQHIISSNVKKKTVAIVGKNRLTDRTFRPHRASSAFRRREAIGETYIVGKVLKMKLSKRVRSMLAC